MKIPVEKSSLPSAMSEKAAYAFTLPRPKDSLIRSRLPQNAGQGVYRDAIEVNQ